MKDKKKLVRAHDFLQTRIFQKLKYQLKQETAHLFITKKDIAKAFLCQSNEEAPGPNKHNSWIICILWKWDPNLITSGVTQTIRLQYHLKQYRYSKGVFFQKFNMRDCKLVKSYQVIILLNCSGKVVGKLIAKQILQFCESNRRLHNSQLRATKNGFTIGTAAILVHICQVVCKKKQIAWALLINMKGAFDHVSQVKLVQKKADLGINNDFIEWKKSVLSDRWVELVIDRFINPNHKVKTRIPQGLPVSLNVFPYTSVQFFWKWKNAFHRSLDYLLWRI